MRLKTKTMKYPLIIVLTIAIVFTGNQSLAHAFTDQVVQRGATGDDVVELQARLQYIGFYNGKIDGVYGWGTYWAVRNFQKDFGLEVDGLVGPQMKDMLVRSTNFDKEFVHRALNEGRRFTHYGGMPLEHQKGPKGEKDYRRGQGAQQQPQQAPAPGAQQAPQQGQPGAQQPQQPGGQQAQQWQQPAPIPEQGAEQPAPGADAAPEAQQPTPGAAPEQQPTPGAEEPTPPAAPQEEPTPEPEPVPDEEQPTAPETDVPNIEQAMNVPSGFSDNDIQLMAQCVYAEARGEPYVGMVAVAAVILNRVNSSDFPNTISEVIFEPRAFEPVANGEIYNNPSEEARRAVMDAINGQDPTGKALYFFNPATARSPWVWSRPQIKTIGKHVFAK